MTVDVGEAWNGPSAELDSPSWGRHIFCDRLDAPVLDLDQDVVGSVAEPRLVCVPETGSVHPSMGMWTPRSWATSRARGYPASACRMTPVPGSFVSTRSSLRAASAVPSATTTIPAWIERPMPTPPPWCTLTHDAPLEVLSSALRIGQSAMASEPSSIASVSRYGDATEPESRWSRPMTIGAFTAPLRTSSLKRRPARARSPYPSQQMRAGSPWNLTFSCAALIQRTRAASSENSSTIARSVTAMSSGSPDSATHRNGPLPSQNRGRMYAGTKPGNSNARVLPPSFASARRLLP